MQLFLILLLLFFNLGAVCAPTPSKAVICSDIDHTHERWTKLLERFVKEGRVNYRALREPEASAQFKQYLTMLSSTCPAMLKTWTKNQQLAFWINTYNAAMVDLVLQNYPIKSVRSIGWLPLAAFREEFISMPFLGKEKLSLNDVENEILRKQFHEPRIHFTIVCASKSCPKLQSWAYQSDKLDVQLDSVAKEFLNDLTKNHFKPESGALYLSSIFSWFKGDFANSDQELARFVARYLQTLGDELNKNPQLTLKIEFLDYNWSLNES